MSVLPLRQEVNGNLFRGIGPNQEFLKLVSLFRVELDLGVEVLATVAVGTDPVEEVLLAGPGLVVV